MATRTSSSASAAGQQQQQRRTGSSAAAAAAASSSISAVSTSTTAAEFERAANRIKSAPWNTQLSNDDKLVLYALFKQATVGDCNIDRPATLLGVTTEGTAKWDAWNGVRGMSASEARGAYVQTVAAFEDLFGARR